MGDKHWIEKATAKMKKRKTLGSFGKATPKKIAAGLKAGGKMAKKAQFAKNVTKVSPSNIGSHFTESAADLPAERAMHFQTGNAVLAREQELKNLGSEGRQGVDMPGPSEHGPGTQA